MFRIEKAFTLAEVLITLGIIGVVSAMTMPTLMSNYQSNALATKKLLFEERLEEAMNQMRFHEKLTGYSDVESFVAELGKYLKINETCDSSDMSDCFPATSIDSCDRSIDIDDLVTGEDFASYTPENDFTAKNVGAVFADGTKAIINYDKNCDWLDPYDGGANRAEATSCIAVLADVNGNSGKNTVGNDILPINTTMGVNIEGTCWGLNDTIISPVNCSSGTTLSNCTSGLSSDYWVGAINACEERGFILPSQKQLTALHNYLFDTDVLEYADQYIDHGDIVLNTEKAVAMNLSLTGTYQWSSTPINEKYAASRYFDSNSSNARWYSASLKSSATQVARCVQ
ncbi:MAG: type II secretion system protein [Candidatus Gastranaerophilales bacterium]